MASEALCWVFESGPLPTEGIIYFHLYYNDLAFLDRVEVHSGVCAPVTARRVRYFPRSSTPRVYSSSSTLCFTKGILKRNGQYMHIHTHVSVLLFNALYFIVLGV